MKKTIALSFAAALSAAVLAVPATSQIVVTPSAEIDSMVETVSRDLDRQLDRSASLRGIGSGNGIAIVRFQTDAAGEPENLTVYRKSGDRRLDRVAVHAVNNLRTLSSKPVSLPQDQVYQANIIFADNRRSLDDLSEQLAKEEAARLASSPAERRILALGSAPTIKAGS